MWHQLQTIKHTLSYFNGESQKYSITILVFPAEKPTNAMPAGIQLNTSVNPAWLPLFILMNVVLQCYMHGMRNKMLTLFMHRVASRYSYDHINSIPEQKEKQKRPKYKGKKTEKGKQRQSNDRNEAPDQNRKHDCFLLWLCKIFIWGFIFKLMGQMRWRGFLYSPLMVFELAIVQ